jgi:hypothetical protein
VAVRQFIRDVRGAERCRAAMSKWVQQRSKLPHFAHSYGRKLEETDIETLAVVEGKLRERLPDYVTTI